jgi:aminoglycoside phosphotransferase (APT) family kinase protein
MNEVVRSVLADTLDADPRATEPAPTGNSKRTVFATLGDGRRVVVQYAPGDALATETALWRAIDVRTEVPVADILAAGETTHPETGERLSYVVCERVRGLDLHTAFVDLAPPDRHAVVHTLGRHLGDLHASFPFEGYGEVGRSGAAAGIRVVDPATDWRSWFDDYFESGLTTLAEADPGLAALVPEVRAAVDAETIPESPPATLFPWDFRPGNAMLDETTGTVAAVLDWGTPLAADPALSLAKATYLTTEWYVRAGDRRRPSDRTNGDTARHDPDTAARLREAFRDGYAERRPVPEVPRTYRLAAVVRSAVDARGTVTRPGYPERGGDAAVAFHRDRLRSVLASPVDTPAE